MNIITQIQSKLKAPKGQQNTFGNYKYRSCEDIVEAVKPILAELDCYLLISDDMVMLGDRFYVKATAAIWQKSDKGDLCLSQSTAFAREPLAKKGMDEAQITGATSSYARKYALNGLLAIDDTKDADTQDNRGHVTQVTPDPINMKKVKACHDMLREEVTADKDEPDYTRMQEGMERLTNDERIKALDLFGDEKIKNPSTGRDMLLRNVVNNCLNWHPADNEEVA